MLHRRAALLVMLVACSSGTPSTPSGSASGLSASGSAAPEAPAVRLLYRLEGAGSEDLTQAIEETRRRVRAAGFGESVEVRSEGSSVAVAFKRGDISALARLREALGPEALAIAALDPEGDPLAKLRDVTELPHFHLQSDQFFFEGRTTAVTFLWTEAPDGRDEANGRVTSFIERHLGKQPLLRTGAFALGSTAGVRSYVLRGEPRVLEVEQAEALPEDEGLPGTVKITLSEASARIFEQETRDAIGRRLAILWGDEVMSAPVVQSAIGGGTLQLTIGSQKAGPGRPERTLDEWARKLRSARRGPRLVLEDEAVVR